VLGHVTQLLIKLPVQVRQEKWQQKLFAESTKPALQLEHWLIRFPEQVLQL